MEEKNTICFLMGSVTINNRNIDLNAEINRLLYPKFDINDERFSKAMNKCINNIMTTIISLANPVLEYNCVNTEFLKFKLSETENKIIIKLIINEYITKFFGDSKLLIDGLSKNNIGTDLIELAETFIECIGGKPNKEIESIVTILNFLSSNDMYTISIGFKEGKLHSVFNLNKKFFPKPLADSYIESKIANSQIPIAVDDISKSIQLIMLKYKDSLPQNSKGFILTSSINKSKNTPFSTNIDVYTSNNDFMKEIDELMNQINIKEAITYINRMLLTF